MRRPARRCQFTWRRALVASLCAITLTPATASAGEAVAELGSARVRYDDTRWQLSANSDGLLFHPLGALERDRDPVTLRMANGDASCDGLASNAFASGPYDTQTIKTAAVRIGGVTGERFAANTGCRKATPQGVIICIKFGGHAYLLQSLNAGCSGRNIFSGIDPLDELAAGISLMAD